MKKNKVVIILCLTFAMTTLNAMVSPLTGGLTQLQKSLIKFNDALSNLTKEECLICSDTKPKTEMIIMPCCKQGICKDCLLAQITQRVLIDDPESTLTISPEGNISQGIVLLHKDVACPFCRHSLKPYPQLFNNFNKKELQALVIKNYKEGYQAMYEKQKEYVKRFMDGYEIKKGDSSQVEGFLHLTDNFIANLNTNKQLPTLIYGEFFDKDNRPLFFNDYYRSRNDPISCTISITVKSPLPDQCPSDKEILVREDLAN